MLGAITFFFTISANATCNGALTTSGAVASEDSLATARRMIASKGTERDKLFREEPHYIRIREGIPDSISLVDPVGKIFRHYTSPETLKLILASRTLRAGATPFYYSGYVVDYNVDLTGVFITTREHRPESIGVRPELSSAYVDFKLSANTGILYLRDGILLVPGTARPEGWKVNLYRSPQRSMYPDYAEEFAAWDKNGIPVPLEIPIEVVSSSDGGL